MMEAWVGLPSNMSQCWAGLSHCCDVPNMLNTEMTGESRKAALKCSSEAVRTGLGGLNQVSQGAIKAAQCSALHKPLRWSMFQVFMVTVHKSLPIGAIRIKRFHPVLLNVDWMCKNTTKRSKNDFKCKCSVYCCEKVVIAFSHLHCAGKQRRHDRCTINENLPQPTSISAPATPPIVRWLINNVKGKEQSMCCQAPIGGGERPCQTLQDPISLLDAAHSPLC